VKSAGAGHDRLEVLDGFRALSIAFVVTSHMLPMGKKAWDLNNAAGKLGMALFFTLSGFLIVSQLHRNHNIISFYIRRLFRIVPLAGLAVVIAWSFSDRPITHLLVNLAFLENVYFPALLPHLGHFWSLCVEMHFYILVGLLMVVTRFRGFKALFPIWVFFVLLRALFRPTGTIETYFTIDEILAGANLALINFGYGPEWLRNTLRRVPWYAWAALLVLASLTGTEPLHPLRSFSAASLVGSVLFSESETRFAVLRTRPLRYLAEISYALYVIHPATMIGWLGEGATPIIKYAKRPICFALSWGLSHLSTFHYEKHFIALGKRLAKQAEQRDLARAESAAEARPT